TASCSLSQAVRVRGTPGSGARLYGTPDARGAARDMIARLGLNGREEQIAGSLSGGWKQRLALGACTLPDPLLLLLDEPTAGVDPKARREFWSQIHGLAAVGLPVLCCTHHMDEAERCHEIAYIAYGELLAHGTVDAVIAAANLVTYTVSGEGLSPITAALEKNPDIMVAPFGNSLHVSARDKAVLDAAIAPYRDEPGLTWTESPTSLEDVFIHLMAKAQDNYQ